jgi:type IV secretory pathway TraG/TraD family ATPase VirD4
VRWTLFNDLVNSKAAKDMARSFVPPASGSDAAQFFHEAAKSLLSAIFIILAKDKRTATNKEIYKTITLPLPKLQKFLSAHPEGQAAYSFIEKADSQQATGVKATLMQYAEAFEDLSRIDGDFSLRQWIKRDGPGFLYLTIPPQFKETLSPIATVAINILIREMLSMPDNLERRRYFLIDEVGALNKLPSLVDGLTLGRSKGMSIWLGVQDFGRIDEIAVFGVYRKILLFINKHLKVFPFAGNGKVNTTGQ